MPPKPRLAIGRRLKALREAAGLTQQQLATRAGLSVSNLSQLEQGQKEDPRISTLIALAGAMGISVAAFVEETGPAAPPKPARPRGRGKEK
jgi:transcriptional regulator with XRE-family HTH domain